MGIMENRMETTIVEILLRLYWGYMGIMENKMETIIVGYIDCLLACGLSGNCIIDHPRNVLQPEHAPPAPFLTSIIPAWVCFCHGDNLSTTTC